MNTKLTIQGRYQLLRGIYRGASSIYEVFDIKANQKRALKFLGASDSIAIENEYSILSRLKHPNLIRVYSLELLSEAFHFEDETFPARTAFMVVEWIDAIAPADVLKTLDDSEKEKWLYRFCDQLADVLGALHRLGLTHGDIKPDNILVDGDRIVLIDLGLSFYGPSYEVHGTIDYMAPEVLFAKAKTQADLYALGASLYQLIMGDPPYQDADNEPIFAILHQPLLPINKKWVRPELKAIIERLLVKDPIHRTRSTEVLRAEIAHAQGDYQKASGLSLRPSVIEPSFVGREHELQIIKDTLEHRKMVSVVGPKGCGKHALVEEFLRREQIRAVSEQNNLEIITAISSDYPDANLDDQAANIISIWDHDEDQKLIVLDLKHPLHQRILAFLLKENQLHRVIAIAECELSDSSLLTLQLTPLNREDARTLVSLVLGDISKSLIEEIYQKSGGFPETLILLCHIYANDGGRELSDWIKDRVDSLDEDMRRLICILALSDAELTHEQLFSCWARDSQDDKTRYYKTLAELYRKRLLKPSACPAFIIDSIAHHILAQFSTEYRRSLARKTIEWLREDKDDFAETDALVLRAKFVLAIDDKKEITQSDISDLWHAAVVSATRYQMERAKAFFARAEVLSELDLNQYDEYIEHYAHVLFRLGDYRAVIKITKAKYAGKKWRHLAFMRLGEYEEALLLLDDSDEEDWVTIVQIATVEIKRGNYRRAQRLLKPCWVKLLENHRRPGWMELFESLGLSSYYLGAFQEANDYLEQGLKWVDSNEKAIRSRLYGVLGMVAFASNRFEAAKDYYQHALEGALSICDMHAASTYQANLGSTSFELGLYSDALFILEQAKMQLKRFSRNTEAAMACLNLAGLFIELGDTDRALSISEEAQSIVEKTSFSLIDAYAALYRAEIFQHNDLDLASSEIKKAIDIFSESKMAQDLMRAQYLSLAIDILSPSDSNSPAKLEEIAKNGLDEYVEDELLYVWSELAIVRQKSDLRLKLRFADQCNRLEARGAIHRLAKLSLKFARYLALVEKNYRAASPAVFIWEKLMSDAPKAYQHKMREKADYQDAKGWQKLIDQQIAPQRSESSAAEKLRRLLQINKRLNSEQRLGPLLELILDTVIELLNAERGFILLIDDQRQFRIEAARNIAKESLKGEELALSRSIAERAAKEDQAIISYDAGDDMRFKSALSVTSLKLRSVLALPLRVKGKIVGTVYVDHRLSSGVFNEEDIAIVSDLADQAAIAIENARLVEENKNREEKILKLNRALTQELEDKEAKLTVANEALRAQKSRYLYSEIIGESKAMQELFHLMDRIASTDLPVVIYGESGTGKELVARAIHQHGKRKKRAFVSENCGAIPETLLESILFGHIKGAFTGADRDKKGLFEIADGGTLFLDEVGEMSSAMQTKLLRVLQDGQIRRVGGGKVLSVDVRVLAATNKNLSELVEEGRFREDLYFRLKVIELKLPSLRERRDDIPILAEAFLKKYSDRKQVFEPSTLHVMMNYDWPGNVRELENEIMRLAALAPVEITPSDLNLTTLHAKTQVGDITKGSLKEQVNALERQLIEEALSHTSNNHSQAAKILGVSRFGLLKKLKRLFPEKYTE